VTAIALEGFTSNAEHLLAEIGWLKLLIEREIIIGRSGRGPEQGDPFKGLYVSESEVERLITVSGRPAAADDADTQSLLEQAAAARRQIDQRRQASLASGVYLALPHLSRVFALMPFEERIVLLALAPEVDLKFERLFAWLQDDISRKRPCVDLAMKLFCANAYERMESRSVFSAEAPLFRARLLRPLDKIENPLLSRPLVLDDPITNFLLSAMPADNDFPPCSRAHASRRVLESLRWNEPLRRQLSEVTCAHIRGAQQSSRRMVFLFHGHQGSGKKTLASCLCHKIGARLLVVDIQELSSGHETVEETLRAAFRHGLLHQYAIFLDRTGPMLADDDKGAALRNALRRSIEDLSWFTFIATEADWSAGDLFRDHTFLTIDLPTPDIAERERIWASFAAESRSRFAPGVSWSELALKFRLTPGQIGGAIETAANRSRLCGPDTEIGPTDLHKGCYAQSNQKLATLARRLNARYTWRDIILPPNAMAQLREVCAQVRHRQRVYGDWGFGESLSLGKGLAVLFFGQSGVGKTMAVEVIANELQLEAFKIDLSIVVSKYIGETEKNLSRIFQEAESSNAILFFDEADALFGKRSEVKDAHDRYANIEINYLLQRIEEFEGLAILATNLRKNIDEGFFRRMHFAIEFPFPDAAHRYRIWQQHVPEAAPVNDDIDFNYLAERFNLAGGSIRNVVVNAAFLAAESGIAISMEHMIRATRREYEKIGRVCTEIDFRPYQNWLAEASTAP
jgi:AAA+ superfamily predicted ATPase